MVFKRISAQWEWSIPPNERARKNCSNIVQWDQSKALARWNSKEMSFDTYMTYFSTFPIEQNNFFDLNQLRLKRPWSIPSLQSILLYPWISLLVLATCTNGGVCIFSFTSWITSSHQHKSDQGMYTMSFEM
jgi:hypothetical protein